MTASEWIVYEERFANGIWLIGKRTFEMGNSSFYGKFEKEFFSIIS
jgi:hypothetical protein